MFPIGASIVTLNETSLGSARCYCCSIICTPADDGRCSRCVECDAWPCPDCNVHVYEDERHEGGRCEECAERAERGGVAMARAKHYPHDRVANTEWEVERAVERKAELLAAHPSVQRHGDDSPRRAYYSICLHREDYGGGFVAYLTPWDQELQFLALYGKHDPDSLWSYEVPAGVKEVFGC